MRLPCSCKARSRFSGCALLVGVLGSFASPACPQGTASLPREALRAEIGGLQQLAAACATNSVSCDQTKVPAPQRFGNGAAGSFQLNWQWMADAMQFARTASSKDRLSAMGAVETHLQALRQQSGEVPAPSSAVFGQARTAAAATLARAEFRSVTHEATWWDRGIAKLQDAVLRLLFGMGRLGGRVPWLAPALEWGCFGLAAAGLLWFVRRSLLRQALRISLTEGARLLSRANGIPTDWVRLAEEQAAAERWREAVHSLYWASIATLEGRRAWRPNTTRTPREYVALLQPGSEAERVLRQLTQSLERVWYGQGAASEAQYRAAQDAFRVLETAKPERAARTGEDHSGARTASLPTAREV